MFKQLVIRFFLFFIIVGFLLQGCAKTSDTCVTQKKCNAKIVQSLKKEDIQSAMGYYNQLVSIEGGENIEQLYNISKQVLLNIYNKKINYGSGANFILWTDNLYKRTNIPYVREKTGMKRFSENIELSTKMNSFYAGSILHCDDETDTYLDSKLELLKNPEPTVRGTAAAMISNMNSKKYLKNLKHVFENDEKYFVRYYALKGLILNDYETYKPVAEETFKTADILGKVIISGTQCAHGDSSKELVLKVALLQGGEILKARALEGYIFNKNLSEKDAVVKLLNHNNLALRLLAARLITIAGTDNDIQILRKDLNTSGNNYGLSKAIALLEIGDLSGLSIIKEALISDNYIKQTFAAQSIINFYRNKHGCK